MAIPQGRQWVTPGAGDIDLYQNTDVHSDHLLRHYLPGFFTGKSPSSFSISYHIEDYLRQHKYHACHYSAS